MTSSEAIPIIKSLADGVDPNTGGVFADHSPYQNPRTIRALFLAATALERLKAREKRAKGLPEDAGKPWGNEEDRDLRVSFDTGMTIRQIADRHKRTAGAVQSRLEKLGKLPPNG